MIKRLLTVCVLLLLPTLAAQAQVGQPPQLDVALAALGQQVGRAVTLNDLSDWSWEQASFPDTSLGCPQEGISYAQVVTTGYRFTLVFEGVAYDYRVSNDGGIVVLCHQEDAAAPATPTPLSPEERDRSVVCPNPEPGARYLPARLTVGIRAQVAPAAGAVNLRQDAAKDAAAAGEIPGGALFDITSGPLCADGMVWWQLNYDGQVGWAAEGEGAVYWLEPAPGRPLPEGLLVIDAAGAPFVSEQSRVQGAVSARLALDASGTTAAVPGGAGVNGVWFYTLAALGQQPTFMPGVRTYTSLAYSPDGALLLLGASDGWFELRDTATQRVRWEDLGHNANVNAAAYAPNGSTLATAGPRVVKSINVSPDNTILLWDTAALAMKAALAGHTGAVNALAFSPDSRALASASDDAAVILWDAASGAELARLEGHSAPVRAVAFSPDGALIASADTAGTVIIWDAQTRAPLHTLETVHTNAVAFSPDGALLATGGGTATTAPDYAIRLWDVASGEELAQLTGHTAPVGALAFNAAGTVLVSASEDLSLRFWGLTAAG